VVLVCRPRGCGLGAGAPEDEVMRAVRGHFKPEFLNRIDEIVVFRRLTEVEIEEIVGFQVAILQARLAERGLTLELLPAAQKWVAQTGYDPDFGARPLKRVLQREIADPIALEVLKGVYQSGDTITVDANPDGGLVFEHAATAEIVG
jgi:ATP-dependent Clp protease ATP-binding subunit ClpB